jgi:hypothetical protein
MADFRIELERLSESPNHFAAIQIGHYVLSIQASEGHYCTPRQTLPKGTDYLSFELAIINARTHEFMHPNQSSVLRKLLPDEASRPVMGWVNYETIQNLINELKAKHQSRPIEGRCVQHGRTR